MAAVGKYEAMHLRKEGRISLAVYFASFCRFFIPNVRDAFEEEQWKDNVGFSFSFLRFRLVIGRVIAGAVVMPPNVRCVADSNSDLMLPPCDLLLVDDIAELVCELFCVGCFSIHGDRARFAVDNQDSQPPLFLICCW